MLQQACSRARACRMMACISEVISLSGFSSGTLPAQCHWLSSLAQVETGKHKGVHMQCVSAQAMWFAELAQRWGAPAAGSRPVSVYVKRPALQHLLRGHARHHEHHLLQLPLQQPVWKRRRPQLSWKPDTPLRAADRDAPCPASQHAARRAAHTFLSGVAVSSLEEQRSGGAPDICCSTLLRYCVTPGSVVTIMLSP